MTAQILQFPKKPNNDGYRISLYTDDEILLTIIALNAFGNYIVKITMANLIDIDPKSVIQCLEQAKTSDLFSKKAQQILEQILKSVEYNIESYP